ncbi:four helix bundle protein [Taibaiella soli]|uniref:four helix bundle protein n=1 Tax=Taibaiella soli TaxID=1649169 RepID=UPI0014040775
METFKTYKSFTELEVWQQARNFKIDLYELIQSFPTGEKYSLTDQIKRASRSIASNIAEGYGRFSYKDQMHFCILARGSLFECQNHIIDAHDCQYISDDAKKIFLEKSNNLSRILNGYISWLKTMANK